MPVSYRVGIRTQQCRYPTVAVQNTEAHFPPFDAGSETRFDLALRSSDGAGSETVHEAKRSPRRPSQKPQIEEDTCAQLVHVCQVPNRDPMTTL